MEPLCPYFGKCGGCDTQHIDYAIQLKNKKNALAKAIGFETIEVFSGNEYFYRNRLDVLFHKKGIGLRKKDKPSEIINIDRCAICTEKVNKIIAEMQKYFTDNDKTFKSAIIRTSEYDEAVFFMLKEEITGDAIEKIKGFNEKNLVISTGNDVFAVKGSLLMSEKLNGMKFFYYSGGFFQNNTKIAEKMIQHSRKILEKYETKDAHLLDLYGGVGTFGISNSDLFKKTTIVENAKESIDCAKMNKDGIDAYALDASKIKRLRLLSNLFIITDPPRSGMDQKTINAIKELKPKLIIYISCNLKQLEKDIKKFSRYKIESAALFDMFPQTNHIESMVELKPC